MANSTVTSNETMLKVNEVFEGLGLDSEILGQIIDRETILAASITNTSVDPGAITIRIIQEYLRRFAILNGSNSTAHGYSNDSLDLYPSYISDMNVEYTNGCHKITPEDMMIYEKEVAYNMEMYIQPVFIAMGIVFNTIVISILRRYGRYITFKNRKH